MQNGTISPAAVEYAGVQLAPDSVSLIRNRRPIVRILKTNIRKLALRQGFQSERPALQIGMGAALALVWLVSFIYFLGWLTQGGGIYDLTLLLLVLIVPAVWMIFDGLRRGPYLEVTLDDDRRKLPFSRRATPDGLEHFLSAGVEWGYAIEKYR
jgi:hypothetical protein